MSASGKGDDIRVCVAWSPGPRQTRTIQLVLPTDSTVEQALTAAGKSAEGMRAISLWGRKVRLSDRLQEGDRIALCRPLRVDPKVARRQRFVRQGAGPAGLFARRRPGAKPGY